MSILFIADVHLCNTKPQIINAFLNFLYNQAIQAQALYILGDLFEIWLGDDDQNVMHINIAKGLQRLNKKKIPCYFIRGNHDFLLGAKYANFCGMTLLPENQILKLPSGKNIMILHGDTLCMNDKLYKKFRKILRSSVIQKIFLSLPFSIRLYIFNILHTCYTKYTKNRSHTKLRININKIIQMLNKYQSKIIIHGHIHQPAIHNIQSSTKLIFKQVVLGNWNKYGSMVEIDEKKDSITLVQFPLNTTQ